VRSPPIRIGPPEMAGRPLFLSSVGTQLDATDCGDHDSGMQSTTLRFLCKDGAISVQFTPELTASQYAELHDIVGREDSCEELTTRLKVVGAKWGLKVTVDDI
jgi:hypothetical protein